MQTYQDHFARSLAAERDGNRDLVTTRIAAQNAYNGLQGELEQLIADSQEALQAMRAGQTPRVGHGIVATAAKSVARATALEIEMLRLVTDLEARGV